jgi:hypothetical protein
MAIDVGSAAISRANYFTLCDGGTQFATIIDFNNPANEDGYVDCVQVYMSCDDGSALRVGSFSNNAGTFTCHDAKIMGSVYSGLNYFMGVNIHFLTGEYIGCDPGGDAYANTIETVDTGYSGIYKKVGTQANSNLCDIGDSAACTLQAGDCASIYGSSSTFKYNLRGVGVSAGSETTDCQIAQVTGLTVGDLMIAHIVSASATDVTAPAEDWTKLGEVETTTDVINSTFFWMLADADDVAEAHFNFTTAHDSNCGAIVAFYSTAALTVTTYAGQANSASTTITAPTVTHSAAESLILLFCSLVDNHNVSGYAIATSNPATWYEAYDKPMDLAHDIGLAMAFAQRTETTGTGNGTATTTSDRNIGQLVVIELAIIFVPHFAYYPNILAH